MPLNRKLPGQDQPIRSLSKTQKYLSILGIGLLALIGIIVLVEMDFRPRQQDPVIDMAQPKPPKQPEVQLGLVVTHCEKITTMLDYTGTTEGSSDYIHMAGYVENHGELTVKFVRAQLIWRDKDDRVVETTETFAVGETPLAPGERVSFEASKRNYLIQKCNAKIIDWWVVGT
jgi:hypothetical protein